MRIFQFIFIHCGKDPSSRHICVAVKIDVARVRWTKICKGVSCLKKNRVYLALFLLATIFENNPHHLEAWQRIMSRRKEQ